MSKINITEKASKELQKLLHDNVGKKLRLYIAGFG